jgi:predicted SAM-dependent methyltransferase
LEYWDEESKFHQAAWSVDDGFISRSANNDRRNHQGELGYTSLIVDGIKLPLSTSAPTTITGAPRARLDGAVRAADVVNKTILDILPQAVAAKDRMAQEERIHCRDLHEPHACNTTKCEIQRSAIRTILAKGEPLRVLVGAGGTKFNGWVSTDFQTVNLLIKPSVGHIFDIGSVDTVLAEHVFEHFDHIQAVTALESIHCILRPGGRVRIAVPDALFLRRDYIPLVFGAFGVKMQPGHGYPGHHSAWTYKSLSAALELTGFEVRLLEYWDDESKFHQAAWSVDDGFISRSANNDRRNHQGELGYTSLIVDGIKL